MLECRGSNKDIFGALDYRVELRPWDEDDDEDGDCDDDDDDQDAKGTNRAVHDEDEDEDDEDGLDDERPNYVFIYDPPKRSDE